MDIKHSHPGAWAKNFGRSLRAATDQPPVTGRTGAERQEEILDSLTEVKHWDLVPGSPGGQVPETPMEDEDGEGRSESEQLAEEGVAAAERDQIYQAARAAGKN
ncbi:MAG: hypothetical protein ACHQ5A_13750 [Opitutales bacterium]